MVSTPQPPNPYATAAAQTQANREAVYDSARVNQINEVGPTGSRIWAGEIGSPDRTVTTTMSPAEQAKYDLMNRAIMGAGSHVENRLGQITDEKFSLDGAPARQYGGMQTTYAMGGPLATGIDDAGGIQRQVAYAGPIARQFGDAGDVQRRLDMSGVTQLAGVNDFSADRQRVEDAIYSRATSRLDPQFQKAEADLDTRLANQGITATSNPEAYYRAKQEFSQGKNDAYDTARTSAIGAAGQEQGRIFGQSLAARGQTFGEAATAGGFVNQAQQQQYGQNLGRAQFANEAQGQQYGQNLSSMQAANAAQAQQFGQNAARAQFQNDAAMLGDQRGMQATSFANQATQQNQNSQNAARDAWIQELIMQRQMPLNELNALLSGNQVNMPQFGSIAQYQQAAPDVGGYIMNNYNQQMAGRNALLGALGSMAGAAGSAAIMRCWVAREVYGAHNPRWLKMREWMDKKAPAALRAFYFRRGAEIAEYIKDKPVWRTLIRDAMDMVPA
jgi:hypothetical protein